MPIGIPPVKETEASGGATTLEVSSAVVATESAGGRSATSGIVLDCGSVLSQAARATLVRMRSGARNRASRRESLKLWGMRGLFLSPELLEWE
jgi:hypothetical protein